jgi:hypothetical protein
MWLRSSQPTSDGRQSACISVHEQTATIREWTTVYRVGPSSQEWIPVYVLDEEPDTEQSPLGQQVVDNIPGEIHQLMDRRLHCWGRIGLWCSRALTGPRSQPRVSS